MGYSIIAAVASNGGIGLEGRLPWSIPEDLWRFKQLTMGGVLVMGRRTVMSLRRPLPGREIICVTSSPMGLPYWVMSAPTVGRALEIALRSACLLGRSVFAAGGTRVYQDALPGAERMYLTRIGMPVQADTFFPEVRWSEWEKVSEEKGMSVLPVAYQVWDRRAPPFCDAQ